MRDQIEMYKSNLGNGRPDPGFGVTLGFGVKPRNGHIYAGGQRKIVASEGGVTDSGVPLITNALGAQRKGRPASIPKGMTRVIKSLARSTTF